MIPTTCETQAGNARHPRTRGRWLTAALCCLPLLAGCGFFVSPDNTSSSGGSTGTSTAYVINSAAATVSGYVIGSGALTAVSGLPGTLGYTPQAAAVSMSNTYLWIAGPDAIYAYTIGGAGVISSVGAVANATVASLTVSPDGQWLIGLDSLTQVIDVFSINTSTGALNLTGQYAYTVSSGTVVPHSIRISPNASYLFAALGTGGDVGLTFNTSTGVASQSQTVNTGSTTVGDNDVFINSANSLLFIARSGASSGIVVYSIGSSGNLTAVTGSPFATGSTPYALQTDATGTYLYAANRGSGTISGFTIGSTGALTALAGSPFTSGSLVQSLALDSSGKYLFSAAYGGAPDLNMYAFSVTTPGVLTPVTTETPASGDGSVLVVTTH